MRARTIGSGVLIGLALTASATLSAPSALATQDSAEVFITADGSPQAGENIEVVVRCYGEVGQPESPVLVIGELQEVESPADIPTYVAPATIDADAEPGDYPLTATCDGETLSWPLTVYPADENPGERPDEGSGDGDDADGSGQQVTRTPRGAPETGAGEQPGHAAVLFGAAGLAGLGVLAGRRLRA